MKRYVALLRGINISGKNKIPMALLKEGFVELGFTNVISYLNSGNVIFSNSNEDTNILANKIQAMIKDKFDLDIPVLVILQETLEEVLHHAPTWWGDSNKEIYDNLIFFMPTLSYEEFYDTIGDPKEEYEKVYHYKNVIFWSFCKKEYQKTNWWSKTANTSISTKITIRTASTIRKIVAL